jgi:hypothetical protein
MTMSKADKRGFQKDLKEGPDRSRLFWWLVEHASEIRRERGAKRIDWHRHCARFAKLAITDANGQRPTPETARKTWLRVRQFLAKEPPLTVPETDRLPPPSRQRADWQPPLAEVPRTAPALPYRRYEPEEELPPRRPSALPPSQAPPATSKPMTIDDLTPEARAKIDRVKSELAEDARKRFGHL